MICLQAPMLNSKNLKAYALMVVDFISGTFVPVLPILVAAGLVSAVLNIGVTFFGLSNESGTLCSFKHSQQCRVLFYQYLLVIAR